MMLGMMLLMLGCFGDDGAEWWMTLRDTLFMLGGSLG